MTPQQGLAAATAMRAAQLLDDLPACHDAGASELEASGLRNILEAFIHGRYAPHATDADVLRWPLSFDRRRLKFAEDFGRAPSGVDVDPEPADAVGLPKVIEDLYDSELGSSRLAAAVDDVLDQLEQGTSEIRSVEADGEPLDEDEFGWLPLEGADGGAVTRKPVEEDGTGNGPWIIVFGPVSTQGERIVEQAGPLADLD